LNFYGPGILIVALQPVIYIQEPDPMKTQTRNHLILLLILAFPIMVLIGFVLSEYLHPPK